MKWPTDRTPIALVFLMYAFGIAFGLYTCVAQSATHERNLAVYEVYDREQAMRVVTTDGKTFLCLITGEGYGFTGNHEKWVALTCAQVGVPLAWQFCRGINNTPQLECIPPGSKVKGKPDHAAPRDKPDVVLSM
jgi:hypothetical protein